MDADDLQGLALEVGDDALLNHEVPSHPVQAFHQHGTGTFGPA